MSRQQAKTQLRLLEETQKSFSVFNLRCYSMCPFSSPGFHTTHLQQRLQTCQASPTHKESSHYAQMLSVLCIGSAYKKASDISSSQPKQSSVWYISLCYSSNDHMGTLKKAWHVWISSIGKQTC